MRQSGADVGVPNMTTLEQLIAGLSDLGLRRGDGVVVHSSLRSFGYLDGGAQSVIRALMAVLSPEGTLVMPSFNHGRIARGNGQGYYDPRTTPTVNGAIPDAFWRQPGVVRSLNPTHAFAAWGKRAQDYVAYHHRVLTMGPASPLGRLQRDGGYGLLLGVGYRPNSFHHVVEMTTGAPCLGRRTEAFPVRLADGRQVMGRTWGYRDGKCPFTDGQRYPAVMVARGLDRRVTIGKCEAILYRLQDCFDVVQGMLSEGCDGFPPCAGCAVRPGVSAHTVASDWDPEANVLRADSEAGDY